ncbi:MAG: spermidine synthase, partial [Deltaproteobacteria bacterium]|nr:spermidine synthase [Deltaproteobacteria bacterium]
MQTLLLYLFAFSSGFAALIYQVAWSRMLSLTFGSSTLAVSAVVAGFMGGMGIGAWLYHRVGDRVSVALRAYGFLEIGIALSTALFSLLFLRLPHWFAAVAPMLPEGTGLDVFRVLNVFLLLLLPSALMGATYPALCQALIHSAHEVEQRLGWIYGLNTLGAATGAVAAGFLL